MLAASQGTIDLLVAGLVPFQVMADLFTTDLGKLLVALVVVGVVVFVGRYVLDVASKILKIAIAAVAVLWLVSVVVPRLGL